MAEVSDIGEANSVLEHFLPRFNQRFRVPPQYPEPAFRPLNPVLCLGTGLCLKHSRRVARDNTVRFQLLPGRLWKDWTAGCRCGMKGASLLPRRRHPARYFSETATGVPHLFLSHPPAPTAWANAGHKGSGREGSRGHQWPRGHSRQAQSHLSAQADVP